MRLELCVVESFVYEAIVPFIKENGLSWVLPVHETVETFLAGTVFAIASNFILIGSTKIVTVIFTYGDVFLGFPFRVVGGLGWKGLEANVPEKEPPVPVEEEPQDHMGYSNDYRPDVTAPGLGKGGKRLVGDVKFKDPLSSNPGDVERRGGFVGFGCTAPATRADVYRLAQRGVKGDGNFRSDVGAAATLRTRRLTTSTHCLEATPTCGCSSSRPLAAGVRR